MGKYTKHALSCAILSIGGFSLLVAFGKLQFGWFETLSWSGFFTLISISSITWACVLRMLHRWEKQNLMPEIDYEKFLDDLNIRLDTEKSPCCSARMEMELYEQKEYERETQRTYHICCSMCGRKCEEFTIAM